MELRRLLSKSIWGGMALLAVLVLAVLHWDARQQASRIEEMQARGEMLRLLANLEARALEVNGALKSWANWTELYHHLKKPDPRFSRDELSARALVVANVDLLTLLDASGNVVEMVEVPGADGTLPATEQAQQNPQVYSAYFKLAQRNQGCGVIQARQQLALVCFSPALDSEGKGEPRGYVLLGRWVDARMVEDITRHTGLAFRVVPRKGGAGATASTGERGAMFRAQVPELQSSGQSIEVGYPIYSIFDRPIADVFMTWQRPQDTPIPWGTIVAHGLIVLLLAACAALLIRRIVALLPRS